MFRQFVYQRGEDGTGVMQEQRQVASVEMDVSDDGVAGAFAAFACLTAEQKECILRGPKLMRFSPRLFAIWKWSLQFIGQQGYVHHAPLVAATLGMAHATRGDKHDFKRHVLEAEGQEGVDWESLPGISIFPNVGNVSDIELQVPGGAVGQTVTIRKGGNATKYPMLTEWFTRRLLVKKDKEFAEFLLCVHDATLAEALGRRMQAEAPPVPVWQDSVEYRRALLELEELEQRNLELKRHNLQGILDFARNNGAADDDRGKIWYSDLARTMTERMDGNATALCQAPSSGVIQDAEPVVREITISEIVHSYIGRTVGNSDLSKIGKIVVRRYREEHNGESPPKRTQYVDGAPRQVFSYNSTHTPLIQAALDEWRNQGVKLSRGTSRNETKQMKQK